MAGFSGVRKGDTYAQLTYKYYEGGTWSALPDFTTLTPVKSGFVATFSNALRNRNDNYGITFTGFINVPSDGIYTFFTNSDDGSNLLIGSTLVVSNDGIHGDQQRSGVIGLKAGKHAITVNYFQGVGGYSLTAAYAGPGITQQAIPESSLFNTNAAPIVNLTAPANNAVYTAPASIVFNATASSTNGSISKVEFYNGATLLGTSTTNPYNFTWSSVASGNYTITAKAYDNLGLTTSASITITVNPANNISPAIVITAPTNNASFVAPANVNITTTATDQDGSITKVEFYNGTVLLGIATTSPFNYNWTSVTAGSYAIVAKAYDNSGATTTSTAVNITVTSPSNVNPTVSITAPTNNASFTAPAAITITATATDSDGSISKVEFYNGTVLLSTATSTPYSYNWTNVTVGNYTITAKAYDNLNAMVSTSITVSVKAANQAPVISILAPVNNASFVAPAAIGITTSVKDADGTISKVEFYNGTILLGTVTASPFNYNWTGVSAGAYSIIAKAFDNLGATASATINVTVVNPNAAPTVSITSPVANANYNAPANITISTSASDQDGTIAKVEYYNGTTLLGTVNSSPYNFDWNNVGAAPYTISVKAYDNLGATATASVNITVNAVSICGSLPTYLENNGYVAGSKVKNVGNQYTCKPWPYSGWCNGASWAYAPGTGAYWTDAWDLVGSCTPSAPIVAGTQEGSSRTSQASSYPNPFEFKTNLQFDLNNADNVVISVYNSQGVFIEEVFNGYLLAGSHAIEYSNATLAEGTYLCKIQSNNKMMVIKLVKVARPKKN